MVLLRLLVLLLVEIPLALILGFCRAVAERPIVQHAYYDCVIPLLVDMVSRVLSHPHVVQHAAAPMVAEGIHEFLTQSERVEQHVRNFTATVSKTQPEWARQQGKDFPLLLRSFFQGMVAATVGKQQQQQQQSSCCSSHDESGERSPQRDTTPATTTTTVTNTTPTPTNTTTTMVMLNVSAVPRNDDDECKQAD